MSFRKERAAVVDSIRQWGEKYGLHGAEDYYIALDEASRRMIDAHAEVENLGPLAKAMQLTLIGISSAVLAFFATRIEDHSRDAFIKEFLESFASGVKDTALPMIDAILEKEKEDERRENTSTGRLH